MVSKRPKINLMVWREKGDNLKKVSKKLQQ